MAYEIVKHDQEMMRKVNKGNILNLIREKKPVSRSELARITGMSPTSVGRIVTELIGLGLIKETELAFSRGVGKKALLLDTEPNSVYVACAQIAGRIRHHLIQLLINAIHWRVPVFAMPTT